MTLSELLNSDISTLSRQGRDVLEWWLTELRGIIPAGFGDRGVPVVVVNVDDGLGDGAAAPAHATIAIAQETFLERQVEMPQMSASDLRQMVALDSERYFPMPNGSALLDAVIVERDGASMMTVDLAALPVARARSVADTLRNAGTIAYRIVIARNDGANDLRFDFAPAFRSAGLLPPRENRAALWWVVVGFLFAVSVAMLIWRDQARVDQVQAMVDAQQPSVDAARRIANQMRQGDRLAVGAIERRHSHDVLGDLAATTSTLPSDAWVQRYVWDARSLRLTGYAAPGSDLVPVLRRMRGVASVKSTDGETVAESNIGRPFDVTLTFGPR